MNATFTNRSLSTRVTLYLCIYVFIFQLYFNFFYSIKFVQPEVVGVYPKSVGDILLNYFFCLLPIAWAPKSFERPSNLIYWFLYLLTYVPMVFATCYAMPQPSITYIGFLSCLCLGTYIMTIGYSIPIPTLKSSRLIKYSNPETGWKIIYIILALLLSYIIRVFWGGLELINPFLGDDVYAHRFENTELYQNRFVGYLIMPLAYSFVPFLLSCGLYYKSYMKVLLSIVTALLLYTTGANKAFLYVLPLTIAIFVLFMYVLKLKQLSYFVLGSVAFLFIGLLVWSMNISERINEVISLFILRIYGISSGAVISYIPFFETHPFTYYSHINGLDKFIDYPYGNTSLGLVIGKYVSGSSRFNFCANFWLTDGLAAFGNIGMLIASFFAAALFWITDFFSQLVPKPIAFASLAGIITIVMNSSLANTLISGGWVFILCLYFLLLSKSKN